MFFSVAALGPGAVWGQKRDPHLLRGSGKEEAGLEPTHVA